MPLAMGGIGEAAAAMVCFILNIGGWSLIVLSIAAAAFGSRPVMHAMIFLCSVAGLLLGLLVFSEVGYQPVAEGHPDWDPDDIMWREREWFASCFAFGCAVLCILGLSVASWSTRPTTNQPPSDQSTHHERVAPGSSEQAGSGSTRSI